MPRLGVGNFEIIEYRGKITQLHYIKVNLVSIENLIELKKRSGKKKDIEDIKNLKLILEGL